MLSKRSYTRLSNRRIYASLDLVKSSHGSRDDPFHYSKLEEALWQAKFEEEKRRTKLAISKRSSDTGERAVISFEVPGERRPRGQMFIELANWKDPLYWQFGAALHENQNDSRKILFFQCQIHKNEINTPDQKLVIHADKDAWFDVFMPENVISHEQAWSCLEDKLQNYVESHIQKQKIKYE